jgi:hypothetical protein
MPVLGYELNWQRNVGINGCNKEFNEVYCSDVCIVQMMKLGRVQTLYIQDNLAGPKVAAHVPPYHYF